VAHEKLVDDVPDEVKRRRNNELLALQNQISAQVSAEYAGGTVAAFVQGISRRQAKQTRREGGGGKGGVALTIAGRAVQEVQEVVVPEVGESVQMSARTEGDLIVFFDAPAAVATGLIGQIVNVRIERTTDLALHGRLC